MNTKSVLGTIGVVLALALSVVNYNTGTPVVEVNVPPSNPTPVQVVNNVPEQGAPTVNVAPAKVTVEAPKQTYGSVTGPDSYLPYVANNNVRTYSDSFKMLTGTTTPCAYKSPSATSTLKTALVSFSNSTTTATVVQLFKSATAFATTTFLSGVNIAANTTVAFTSTTTSDSFVFSPSQYVVLGVKGGAGVTNFTGTCAVEFVSAE